MLPNQNITLHLVSGLTPHPDNPRVHDKVQISKIAASIDAFGFRFPILIDANGRIISGHGRWLAAQKLGLETVPVIMADDLKETQIRALMIADNRLSDLSGFDDDKLVLNFEHLLGSYLDFDIELTGFDYGEIEFKLNHHHAKDASKLDDRNEEPPIGDLHITPRARLGDLWALGQHRVLCGDALLASDYTALMNDQQASIVFTDVPYNLPARTIGKVCDRIHGNFAHASGEMSREEFTSFLTIINKNIRKVTAHGAICYHCIDWRHIIEMQQAGEKVFDSLRNLCVWAKSRAGQGSFYRSQHEFVFVWQVSPGRSQNNFKLGQYGRYRSNLWEYPSAASFTDNAGDLKGALQYHPTVKPVGMIEEALKDTSRMGEIVLDPFLGSGSTVIAAQKTGRHCYGLEIDPSYVDLIPFSRGHIYRILSNPIYVGKIQHKDKVYDGHHEAIISKDLWDQVQAIKNGTRYSYYVSQKLKTGDEDSGWRIPALTIEQTVRDILISSFASKSDLLGLLPIDNPSADQMQHIVKTGKSISERVENGGHPEVKTLLNTMIDRIELQTDQIRIIFNTKHIAAEFSISLSEDASILLAKPMTIRRRGQEMKMVIGGEVVRTANFDHALIKLVARAHLLKFELEDGKVDSIKAFAVKYGLDHGDAKNLVPLSFLAPSIVEDILAGRQPLDLNARNLKYVSNLPVDWNDQRQFLGFN